MGATTDLRNYLKDDTARVRFGLFKKTVTASGKTVEVGQNATHAEVAQALTGSSMTDPLPVVEIAPPADGKAAVAAESIKKNLTGASFLANLIREQQAAIKKQLADAGTEMSAAMTELQGVANEATNQVKAVKAETADLKAALGLNSNGDEA